MQTQATKSSTSQKKVSGPRKLSVAQYRDSEAESDTGKLQMATRKGANTKTCAGRRALSWYGDNRTVKRYGINDEEAMTDEGFSDHPHP